MIVVIARTGVSARRARRAQSFLAAIEEGAKVFDFGIGDQPYKRRFATTINQVRTWALYRSRSNSMMYRDSSDISLEKPPLAV